MLTSLRGALSDVAFTSQSEMGKQTPNVIKNQLIKNEEPTPDTQQCIYFREYEVLYKFENENKKHIYYFMFQCLDENFNVLINRVKFNYDGSQDHMELPEGCLPPQIPEKPDNPCTKGFELGEDAIKQISTLITKKLVVHPLEQIPEFDIAKSIDSEKLDQMKQKLPELEKLMEQVLEDNHSSNTADRKPDDVIENDDGTKTDIYHFSNGDVAEKTKKENGDIETILYKSDNTVEVRTDMPGGISDVTIYDEEGIAVYHKSIEPVEENPDFVRVTTYNYDDEIVGKPQIYPRVHADDPIPLDVQISGELAEKLELANETFADAIQNYVQERLNCFSEHLIDVKESYLTFVCSTTGHSSIKDVLRKNFGEAIVCGKHLNCEEIEEELVDRMLTHINMGGTGHEAKVQSGAIKTEMSPRA